MTFNNLLALGSILVWASAWAATPQATASYAEAKGLEQKATATSGLKASAQGCGDKARSASRLDSDSSCRMLK